MQIYALLTLEGYLDKLGESFDSIVVSFINNIWTLIINVFTSISTYFRLLLSVVEVSGIFTTSLPSIILTCFMFVLMFFLLRCVISFFKV